ncbi:MAG TPA: cytochrome c oxidase subunit II [Gemmatimonadales bacterium]|nr:cytochrome c oxidase subunit II [Gemmatimonadales bacterium]
MLQSPTYLRTFGPIGDRVAALGWSLLIISSVVVLVVSVLVLAGVWRRGTRSFAPVERAGGGLRWIVIGGIVVPTVILVVVFVLTMVTQAAVASPATAPGLTVRVTGHQWWWEVQYLDPSPDRIATTANEIHIPVGRPVRIEVAAGDVIHSFWVPELAGKTDLIPGQTNVTWVQADHPGVYRGQCAEYCGLQHAKMAMSVVAEPPAAFDEWLARQRQPAAPPSEPDLKAGAAVFAGSACALCHTIRGTMAVGRIGPDLTHLAGRRTIAAGTLPNTRGYLAGWIANPQALKPGTVMPAVPLESTELQVLITYLQSLN